MPSALPGMEHGMFFEYYVFEPRTNFEEADLYYVLQHFDCAFAAENAPPHPHHFNGQIFSPREGITVDEFVDILVAMNIRVHNPSVLSKLPEQVRDHFNDDGEFAPFDDFNLRNLCDFLVHFVHFRMTTGQFNTLPKRVKRHFIVFTRDGQNWRYGDRRPG